MRAGRKSSAKSAEAVSRPTNAAAADWHGLSSLLRLGLAGLILIGMAWYGGAVFERLDATDLARRAIEDSPILRYVPEFLFIVFDPRSWRYCLPPLGAMFAVFVGAAYFVKDIYALNRLRDAVQYVVTSMFSLMYPELDIKAGEAQLTKGKTNLLDAIGGPGYCSIQPGNVVMFRHLTAPSNITIGKSYFMEPFERIGPIANLEDQHDDRNDIKALTRDGIKVTIRDVHFRYRFMHEVKTGQPVRRSPSDPYPFDEQAFRRMINNLVVEENGVEEWRRAVGRVIVGGITDYINDHTIDYLTAPRENRQDPRREIRNRLFFGEPRLGLRSLGAELLWVDIGHFSIDEGEVDEIRQNLWAAEWLGEALVTREFGVAKRQAYEDLGRAEAQAELIVAIADALKMASNSIDPAANMRRILLVRTAQILDAYDLESKKALEVKKP